MAPRLRQATTDDQGQATFPPLDGGIWYLTLHGTVAGRPIEDSAAQGKPPWGTNPAGGGFPIVVDPPLENAAAISTPAASAAPALVPIVLVDRQDLWIAGIDLGSATSAPISLPAAVQADPGPPPTPMRSLASSTTLTSGPDPVPVVLIGLAGLVLTGSLALYRRHHPHHPVSAAHPRSNSQARAAGKETYPHA
jgi:hypothetical protein